MAIGDNGTNNNNSNKLYESTYYSRLKFKNDKLSLSVSFRSGLLILEINELKDDFKYESMETIYLSPTKALLLSEEIKKFKEYLATGDIIPGKAFGVNAGMNDKISFIGIHANENKIPMITIGKFDSNGQITEQATINLNVDYHYALEWNDINTMDVSKCYYDNAELDQLITLLEDFSRYMNGAIGYSVADTSRFDYNRMYKKLDPIYDKLGIERKTSNSNGSYSRSTNSFLDNAGRTSNHTTFDGIEDMIE